MPAYSNQPSEQIATTARMLRWYRAFIRSDATAARDPQDRYRTIDRKQAQDRLTWLVNVAINRKAGLPDSRGRKDSGDYRGQMWRDAIALRDKIPNRVRVYQFELPECRIRFAHLLSRYDD